MQLKKLRIKHIPASIKACQILHRYKEALKFRLGQSSSPAFNCAFPLGSVYGVGKETAASDTGYLRIGRQLSQNPQAI